jgi:hypothetical protein
MYIVIDKSTQKSYIFREKKYVAEQIGVHVNTISNNESGYVYKKNEWEVYFPSFIQKKSRRGGKKYRY